MRFSIRISILQIFALLLILTVVSITGVFYLGSSRIMVDLYSMLARVQAEKLIERTVAFVESPGRLTRMTAAAFEDMPIVGQHEKIWDYLWKQLILTPQVASYYMADPQGSFIQARRTPELATRLIDRTTDQVIDLWHFRNIDYGVIRSEIEPADFDPRTRPWYKATRPETGIYWSNVYRFQSTHDLGITGSCPILNNKAVKGPLATMISEIEGHSASAAAVAMQYEGLLDGYAVHLGDSFGADYPILETNILIQTKADRLRFAGELLDFARSLT